MKKINACVKDALAAAAMLYALLALALILRGLHKSAAREESADAKARRIERAAFEETQRSLLLLHRRVGESYEYTGEVRHSVEEMGKRVGKLEGHVDALDFAAHTHMHPNGFLPDVGTRQRLDPFSPNKDEE